MGELKVWVDGLQRIVSGINDKTTCQDVIIALARFKRQTGRYTLVEKSLSHESPLEPHENPLRIMSQWSGGSNRFIMKRTGDVNGADQGTAKGKPSRFCEKHRSMECLSRPKETTVKRGNTFSGSWNSQVLSKKETGASESKPSAIDLEELWELVREQERILEEQYEDMEDLDIDIEELMPYEIDPPTIEDLEDQIIRYERTLKKNESRLEEEEFWEDELEMEEEEKGKLIEELNKTKEQIIECEKEIQENKQEIKQLMKTIKAEKNLADKKQQRLDDDNRKKRAEKRELQEELEAQEFEGVEYEQELEELTEELKLLEVEFKRKIEEELKLQRDLEQFDNQASAAKMEEKKMEENFDDKPAIPIKQKSSSNPIDFLRGGVLRRLKGSPRELSVSKDEPEGVFV